MATNAKESPVKDDTPTSESVEEDQTSPTNDQSTTTTAKGEEEEPDKLTDETEKDSHVTAAEDSSSSSKATEEKKEEKESDDEDDAVAKAMTLDVAYKSLEMVREVNLQVEFGCDVPPNTCIPCFRIEKSSNLVKSKFGKWMAQKAAAPCLTCSTPVCKMHRSSDFGKRNIAVVCCDCAHLFSVNYLLKNIVNFEDEEEPNDERTKEKIQQEELNRKQKINNMLEVYDRALLILNYSMQFLEGVALSLEGNTSRHNKVGLGTSATGVVAGGLGVAAACTIFTPVGPPLLLASILFGGGATAVTAGSEAVNYRCEPNKMADRILTLHSVITSIARLPGMMDMEDASQREEEDELEAKQKNNKKGNDQANNNGDDRQSRLHLVRTAMNGLKPLTAGALSAVSIVTEAREMHHTVEKIRAGNPCEKAKRLRNIEKEIPTLPLTDDLLHQLNIIIQRRQDRRRHSKIIVASPPATKTTTIAPTNIITEDDTKAESETTATTLTDGETPSLVPEQENVPIAVELTREDS